MIWRLFVCAYTFITMCYLCFDVTIFEMCVHFLGQFDILIPWYIHEHVIYKNSKNNK